MGIKNLSKIIKQYKVEYNLYSKENIFKKIAIDTSLFMHKFGYILYNYEEPDLDLSEEINNCFYKQFCRFKKAGIKVVYIFDNQSHCLKKETIEKRKEKNVKVIKSSYYANLKTSFTNKEIPYILAPSGVEAEHFAAYLNKNEIVDAVLSEDLDTIIFGCKYLITGLDYTGKCSLYNTKEITEKLELNETQLVQLAISLGCDYNNRGLKNYGPVKALKYIKSETFDLQFLSDNIENYDKIFSQFTHQFKDLNLEEYNKIL